MIIDTSEHCVKVKSDNVGKTIGTVSCTHVNTKYFRYTQNYSIHFSYYYC